MTTATVLRQVRQRGISLLEVLLSLSIIAIILIMATRYFFVASHNDKVNTTVSQIGGLIAAVHNVKGADAVYPGDIDIKKLIEAGQLTNFPGFSVTDQKLRTMWGQDISIKAADGLITVTVPLPDKSTCTAMSRAYPADDSSRIQSECLSENSFNYTFP